jgi:NAD-dependent deacetylase
MAASKAAGRPFYAFTGAGMSTDSGLPDFRSSTGMWNDAEAEKASSQWGFDENPDRVWEMYVGPMFEATLHPNPGHEAIAQLVQMGLLSRVVTQNVDELHELAGVDESRVDHLHGDLKSAVCMDCLRGWPMSEKVEIWRQTGAVPTCEECARPLQPSLTLFGQDLPPGAWRRASQVARQAAGVLVCGSSLAVTPANELPYMTGRLGGCVAILNRGETEMDQALDPTFDFRFDGSLSHLLADLVQASRELSEDVPES